MDSSNSPRWHAVAAMSAWPVRSWPAAALGSCTPSAARGGAGIRIPPFMRVQVYSMNSQWPLQDFLELGALISAVPCARLHVRQVLWEWGLARVAESAELAASELTTNAVMASRVWTRTAAVRLWLASDRAQVLIIVWDASPQPPVRVDASGGAENGRGLMLVEAISEEWGWCFRDDIEGKFVWAMLQAG
jgi:anti-sigma regulatory factor (Ser/Thr protein kinase)